MGKIRYGMLGMWSGMNKTPLGKIRYGMVMNVVRNELEAIG